LGTEEEKKQSEDNETSNEAIGDNCNETEKNVNDVPFASNEAVINQSEGPGHLDQSEG